MQGRSPVIIAVLCALFLLPTVSPAETRSIDFTFTTEDLRIRPDGDFSRVEWVDEPVTQWEPGQPWLPAQTAMIRIPDDAVLRDLRFSSSDTEIALDRSVMPYQPLPHPSQADPVAVTPPDPAIYDANSVFPAVLGQSNGAIQMRGHQLVSVTLYPVRVFPPGHHLILSTNLSVTVEYDQPASKRNTYRVESETGRSLFHSVLTSLAVNPADGQPDRGAVRSTRSPPTTIDYLVITEAALSNAFVQLTTHRESFNQFTTRIVTTESIEAQYAGIDTQEKIRNCIKDYYQNHAVTFVVLGGDNFVVPDRDCYARVWTYSTGNMPTDLYYSGLDGTWDEDGDGTYGEAGEGDLGFDVIVGRIPIRTAAQASDYINKVIRYEQADPPAGDFFRKTLFMGVQLQDAFSGGARPTDTCYDGLFQFASHSPVSDGEIWQRRMYRDTIRPYWPATTQFGVLTDTITHWDTATPGDYVVNNQHALARLNEGWQLVNMFDHAFYSVFELEDGFFYAHDALALTGLTAVVYSEGCFTGAFEQGDPCVSEGFLRNPLGGAIAYIGCSKEGWFAPGSYYGGPSADYAMAFYYQLYQQKVTNVGQAFAAHKAAMIGASLTEGAERWVQFGLNLQGDPGITLPHAAPYVNLETPVDGQEVVVNDLVDITATMGTGFTSITSTVYQVDGAVLASQNGQGWNQPWTPTEPGTYELGVNVFDSAGLAATATPRIVRVVTNLTPSVAITSPISGTAFETNQVVEIQATAEDADGTVVQVDFYAGDLLLGSDTSAPYGFSWAAPAPGFHDLVAVAVDNVGHAGTSALVRCSVEMDHLAEAFNGGNALDLAGTSILFTPSESSIYTACRTPIAALPVDPTGHNEVFLWDDTTSPVLLSGNSFPFYGVPRNRVFINSNGHLTFDRGDIDFNSSIGRHFEQPRITLAFADLHPAAGDGQVYQAFLPDRLVVTFMDVPLRGSTDGNTMQAELFYDGSIRLSWLSLAVTTCIAGLSPGGGLPAQFVATDLSAQVACDAPPDLDGDGLPDAWELQYFLNSTNAPALADPDGDGASNWEEWFCGTDPTNILSCFRLQLDNSDPAVGMVFRWTSSTGRSYSVEGATNLNQGFTVLESNVFATPPQNIYTDITHNAEAVLHYKVRAHRDP